MTMVLLLLELRGTFENSKNLAVHTMTQTYRCTQKFLLLPLQLKSYQVETKKLARDLIFSAGLRTWSIQFL